MQATFEDEREELNWESGFGRWHYDKQEIKYCRCLSLYSNMSSLTSLPFYLEIPLDLESLSMKRIQGHRWVLNR